MIKTRIIKRRLCRWCSKLHHPTKTFFIKEVIVMKEVRINELVKRVLQFHLMQLPEQPQTMHKETASLINDLLKEVRLLHKIILQTESTIEHMNPKEIVDEN